MPTPPEPMDAKSARAEAKAARARAKAMRPWYQKKRYIGLIVLVVLVAIAAIGGDDGDDQTVAASSGGSSDEECPPTGDDTRSQCLYPDRPDSQRNDHEQVVGGSVRLAGYTTTLHSAQYFPEDGFNSECVLIDVTIQNRDSSAQMYNTFDWRIQTEGGQVLDAAFCGFLADTNIGSGDLVSGGKVDGTVGFDVGPGTYYVIYKPDPFSSARGIWQINAN